MGLDPVVLNNIPFQIDMAELKKRMRVKEGSSNAAQLQQLADEAQTIGQPKALYRLAFIEDRADDCVTVEGVKFKSRVLRVNLEDAQRVFCYVATCGMELESWARDQKDMVHSFWADAVNELVLYAALQYLEQHLTHAYSLAHSSTMNPGSLPDWPIAEQRKLFSLLGDTRAFIGVELTDSLLMLPTKSVSGIRFPLEESFASCQLCPRENCPNRKAPYDKDLFERKYRLLTSVQ